MAGDLGAGAGEVHGRAQEVLAFWFAIPPERRFAVDPALDRLCAQRFGAMRDEVVATRAAGWREDADTLLAAIVLVDQFSRNIFRGAAEAFAHDDLGQELAQLAIAREWDVSYPRERRAFAYMPLMHAEDAGVQRLSVEKFAALGEAENLHFARAHAEVIDRFGRFPSRNAALRRESTPAEAAYLEAGGSGW